MAKDDERTPTAYPGALMDDAEARRLAERRLAAKGWLASTLAAESSPPLAAPPPSPEPLPAARTAEQRLASSGWLAPSEETGTDKPVARSHPDATNAGIQSPPALASVATTAPAAGATPGARSHQDATNAGIPMPPALVSTATSAPPAAGSARQEEAGPELHNRPSPEILRAPTPAVRDRPTGRQVPQAHRDEGKTAPTEAPRKSITSAGIQMTPALVSGPPSPALDGRPRPSQSQRQSQTEAQPEAVPAEPTSYHRAQAHSTAAATASKEPMRPHATSAGISKPPALVHPTASRNRELPTGPPGLDTPPSEAQDGLRQAAGSGTAALRSLARRRAKDAKSTEPLSPSEERISRSIRLTAPIYAKLREVAEARGLDLNAAISVAIAEDWWRYCVSKPPAR